jgi:surfactin synthase thioesterase subunit
MSGKFLRPRSVDNPAVRLIVFHHAGGSAAVYYPFTRDLPEDWDLVLIDLPGRGKRFGHSPLLEMEEIVSLCVEDVQPWLDGPVALFGHSLGAIVATEVARRLDQLGTPPVWVGVSGRIAPETTGPARLPLHELDDADLMDVMFELGGMPDRAAGMPEFVDRFLRTVRADLHAVHTYRPYSDRLPLPCPLTVFGGTSDTWAPPSSMRAWRGETSAEFSQKFFPGGHFYFLGAEFPGFTRELVEQVRAATGDLFVS